jgi:chromosome segregation ATPase
MSGGYGTSRKGLISLIGESDESLREDPKKMYLECNQISKELGDLSNMKLMKEPELIETRQLLKDGKEKVAKIRFESSQIKEKLNVIEERCNLFQNKLTTLEAKTKGEEGIDKKIMLCNEELERIKTEKENQQKELVKVQEELGNIMGEKYKKMKEEFSILEESKQEQEDIIRREKRKLTAAENKLQNAKKFKSETEEKIERQMEIMDDVNSKKLEILDKSNDLSIKLKEIEIELGRVETLYEEEYEKFTEKSKNTNEDEKELNKLVKEIRNINMEIEKYKFKIDEITTDIVKVQNIYLQTLQSFGDVGNLKMLNQLEKTFKMLKDSRNIDMERIIDDIQLKQTIEEDEHIDLNDLSFGKYITGIV